MHKLHLYALNGLHTFCGAAATCCTGRYACILLICKKLIHATYMLLMFLFLGVVEDLLEGPADISNHT